MSRCSRNKLGFPSEGTPACAQRFAPPRARARPASSCPPAARLAPSCLSSCRSPLVVPRGVVGCAARVASSSCSLVAPFRSPATRGFVSARAGVGIRSAVSAAGAPQKQRLVFLGTPDVAASALEAILDAAAEPDALFEVHAVVSQPGKPRGRGRSKSADTPPPPSPVAAAALARGASRARPVPREGQRGGLPREVEIRGRICASPRRMEIFCRLSSLTYRGSAR